MRPLKIAVCVHIYYQEIWDDISIYLRNLRHDFDLFITCRDEIYENTTKTIRLAYPTARTAPFPNIGMDVLPFLMTVHVNKLQEYDAILKLHTKNKKTAERAEQGRIMYEGLLGTRELCDDIVRVFRDDPHAGIVGPALMLRSANALAYGNRDLINRVLSLLEVKLDDWRFFAGTMFWISGKALSGISQIYGVLRSLYQDEGPIKTGGDGALAHTLERVLSAGVVSNGMKFFVTERRNVSRDSFLVMPVEEHGPCSSSRYLESGSTSMLRRSINAIHWYKTIANSGLYDDVYYARNCRDLLVKGMDNILHFILYGDVFYIDPSLNFSVSYYLMNYRDILRSGDCSVAHFVQFGKKEGRIGKPNEYDWIRLAEKLGLFDQKFYHETYQDVRSFKKGPVDHYLQVGGRLGRKTSPNFDPRKIPVLMPSLAAGANPLIEYLRNYVALEEHFYEVLVRACSNGDYGLIPQMAPHIHGKFGTTRALLEAKATSHLLEYEWGQAAKLWKEFWDCYEREDFVVRGRHSIAHFDKPTSTDNNKFRVIDHLAERLVKKEPLRICIYTTLFGNIDDILPIPSKIPGIDYICFTDRERQPNGWELRVSEPGFGDNNLNAKVFKILPHIHLAEYDASLFVDANTLMLGRFSKLIEYCVDNGPFIMWQHPLREDVYLEVAAIIGFQRHPPAKLLEQIAYYHSEGLPRNTGLTEGSFIWRRHNDLALQVFMENWWKEIIQHSKRDQLSLGYLMWKTGVRPQVFPDTLGTSRGNVFFTKIPHKKLNTSPLVSDDPTVASLKRRRDVTFLFSHRFANSGSTVMRGAQLADITRQALGGEIEVNFSADTDVQNKLLILTKGFLKDTSPEMIRRLRKNNVILADFVDEPPTEELVDEVDGLIAASLTALNDYYNRFQDKFIHHITHHVDTRISWDFSVPNDMLRAGYFGEFLNAISTESVQRRVEFIQVDTNVQSLAWMDRLRQFNFHYAARSRRKIDGAKPFLKGFSAAHSGANMLIQRGEGDASFYLGPDYPYLLPESCTEADIVNALERVRAGFGTAEWRYGLQVMADVRYRSSQDFIIGEIQNMIEYLM